MERSVLELGEPIGDAVSRIRFAPRSDNLLISSWDSILRLYDVERSVLRFSACSEGALLDCCFEDEIAALSASSDGCIRRYDLQSGSQTILGKHDDAVTCLQYSHEAGHFVTAGLDKMLRFWDKHMCQDVGCIKVEDADVWSMSLCQVYLFAAVGKMINMYDLRRLKEPVQTKKSSLDYKIKCVRSFSNSEGCAIGSIDGCVELSYFHPAEESESEMGCVFRCHPKSNNGRCYLVAVNDIEFHPGCNTFVTGDNEGFVIVWNAKSRKKLLELLKYPNSIASLSYNHNGQLLAVASSYTYQEANEVEETPQIFLHSVEKEHS